MTNVITIEGLRDWLGQPAPDPLEQTRQHAELSVARQQRIGFVNRVLGAASPRKNATKKEKKAKASIALGRASKPLADPRRNKADAPRRANPIGFKGMTPDRVDPVTGETILGAGGKKFSGTAKLTKAYRQALEVRLRAGEDVEAFTAKMIASGNLTIAEVVALGQACLAASGGKGSTHAARELREATEGRSPQKLELTGILGIAELRNATDVELVKIIREGASELTLDDGKTIEVRDALPLLAAHTPATRELADNNEALVPAEVGA